MHLTEKYQNSAKDDLQELCATRLESTTPEFVFITNFTSMLVPLLRPFPGGPFLNVSMYPVIPRRSIGSFVTFNQTETVSNRLSR